MIWPEYINCINACVQVYKYSVCSFVINIIDAIYTVATQQSLYLNMYIVSNLSLSDSFGGAQTRHAG